MFSLLTLTLAVLMVLSCALTVVVADLLTEPQTGGRPARKTTRYGEFAPLATPIG